jgi:hypothetical protein
MFSKNINLLCLGCLSGCILAYCIIKNEIQTNNKKYLYTIQKLKKEIAQNSDYSIKENTHLRHGFNSQNNLHISESESTILISPEKSNLQLKNDIIFEFLKDCYFPKGILTLFLKFFDFKNK